MSKDKNRNTVKIVGLPKGAVLWPTAMTSIILGILGWLIPEIISSLSMIFLFVFSINLLILFFDFSRGAVIGLLGLFIAAISLAYSLEINIPFDNLIQEGVIGGASSEFFLMYGLVFMILFVLAFGFRRSFEYFELSSNELIKKYGILGDSQRFNAPNMQIKKHISDVFESIILFGAGDLVIITDKGQEFHVYNVPRINKLEKRMTEILSRLDVDINQVVPEKF